MNTTKPPAEDRYISGEYLDHNPDWHESIGRWKYRQIAGFLEEIHFETIIEVGCGSGAVLDGLAAAYPTASIVGYDLSPSLDAFWARRDERILFHRGDFFSTGETADLILLLDVFEHVEDYMAFLKDLSTRANYFIFHIPLDLFALACLTENFARKRKEVGHLHYFSMRSAIATLEDCGYEILGQRLTRPGSIVKTTYARFLRVPRALGHVLFGASRNARILGGYSLAVLCEVRAKAT